MPKIYVNREFTLQLGGEKRHFTVGNHTVDAETAKHWYVQAHIGDEPPADPDTSAAAEALLSELNAREAVIADREQAVQAREADVTVREQALADREQAAQNAQSTPKDDGKASGKSANK